MAYVPANLQCMVPRMGDGAAMWYLTGEDVHTDADAADFISDGFAKGMKVGDTLVYVKSTATVGATLHSVASVTTGGAATLTSAILA